MPLRPHPRGRQPHIQRRQQPRHIAVRDRHPLRHPRRPRRINEISNVVPGRHRLHRGTGLRLDAPILDVDNGHTQTIEPARQPASGDRGHRSGITDHHSDPRIRVRRIQRQIRRPRLQHTQNRHNRINRTIQHQRHTLTRTSTLTNKQVRQPIRGFVEFSIRHGPAVETHRHRIRHPNHLPGKHLRNRTRHPRRCGQRSPITQLIQTNTLVAVQHIDRRQAPRRISRHRRQNPLQPPNHHLDRAGIKHIRTELHRTTNPRPSVLRVEPLPQGEHQIHTSDMGFSGQRRHGNITHTRPGDRSATATAGEVLPREQHLDQWAMRPTARRVEPVHQHLERHILMLKRPQATLTHLPQQLAHGGIVSQVDPQHQRVHEEPDQIIEGRIVTPRNRETHRHIRTGTQTRQQHRQRSLHHHETGRTVLPRHRGHPPLQLRRPLHLHAGTAVIGHRRVRAVRRQLQPIRQPRQGALPVRHLRRDTTIRVGEITQMSSLPQRVIHILHRQRGPLRRLSGTPSGVCQR